MCKVKHTLLSSKNRFVKSGFEFVKGRIITKKQRQASIQQVTKSQMEFLLLNFGRQGFLLRLHSFQKGFFAVFCQINFAEAVHQDSAFIAYFYGFDVVLIDQKRTMHPQKALKMY